MRVAIALLIVTTLALRGVTGTAAPQTPTPRPGTFGYVAPPDPANASISGQVLSIPGDYPVRGAEVRVRATNGRENRLVTTDSMGRYTVRDLTAGEWTIIASKGGFISQQFGQRYPFQATEPVQLKRGERFTANFELSHAGAITGRIYDEFGEPVAGARVQAMRAKMVRGRRQLTAVGVPDQTDDTGAYRLYALQPGEYYIGATLRLAPAENLVIDAPGTTPTYYPGTVTIADAGRIRVATGEEQSSVNFSVTPVRSVRVSGTLMTSTGLVPSEATVNLVSTTDYNAAGFPVGTGGRVSGGRFTVANVPPGSYLAQAFIFSSNNQGGGGRGGGGPADVEQASVPITVGNEDLNGVSLITNKGATITGSIVSDGTPLPAALQFSVSARSTNGGSMEMRGGIAPRSENRNFTLAGLFGTINLSVTVPDGWMVRSIDVDGNDVTDTGFTAMPAETLRARVVVTDKLTTLSGRVTSRRSLKDARIVIFPDDATRWVFQSRFIRAERVDADGTFTIRRLPPEQRYLALAVDYLEDEEQWDPEFLERMKPKATGFSLDESQRKTITVPIAER